MPCHLLESTILATLLVGCVALPACGVLDTGAHRPPAAAEDEGPNTALEWNQVLIDTLIATNTPNSSSQRLGAIVHTAMFDAYNGVRPQYAPIHYTTPAAGDADPRAAMVAAAHAALVGLFPGRKAQLDASYAASLAALPSSGAMRQRGIDYGTTVALAVLAWRAADGFSTPVAAFNGGTTTGQWQPTPPNRGAMSAQTLAFTKPFVLEDSTRFRPVPPRGLSSRAYTEDFNAVKALGRRTNSTRTEDQTALAPFWEGNASVHWNQAANQAAHANRLGLSSSNRLFAVLNIAMADTAVTVWAAKRHYGADAAATTWRPVTAIPLAAADGNPDTAPEADWLPLVTTPSHPEYPAGHPGLNGAAAMVLASVFKDAQTFVLTTPNLPDRRYSSILQARQDGNNARIWGGMHYPSTVAISDALGEAIARHVNGNAMQERKR
jgi:membrane-associated phospholipid phosphatase